MEEDAGTEGCVRVRLRSAVATCNNCMDYLVQQFLFGYMSADSVIGLEGKRKGPLLMCYIWAQRDIAGKIENTLKQTFPNVFVDIQQLGN